ncbi:hypothetical protein [Pseudomonas gingeri]|uniref:Uncharacterized protein n=1 Tax=Pseudomonas gingeri TaxID=117681 RepID=A0A7Y8CLK3_9PSED|nr:hypothetical protein [Pseudomonas gingeri]NWB28444.1 hypothetical protein [Pseudomonas gingeri]NWC34144.1 hypothetical protein [Pseudomonas gingeri]
MDHAQWRIAALRSRLRKQGADNASGMPLHNEYRRQRLSKPHLQQAFASLLFLSETAKMTTASVP